MAVDSAPTPHTHTRTHTHTPCTRLLIIELLLVWFSVLPGVYAPAPVCTTTPGTAPSTAAPCWKLVFRQDFLAGTSADFGPWADGLNYKNQYVNLDEVCEYSILPDINLYRSADGAFEFKA